MVNEVVSIKRPFNYRKLFLSVLGVTGVLGILFIVFFLGSVFGSTPNTGIEVINPLIELLERYEQQGINMSDEGIIEYAELEFNEDYIKFVLYAMSAHKLHNPLLSSDTPKIKIILDESDIYYSEVIDQGIFTYNEEIGNEDIVVKMTKEEVINAMLADDMANFMSNSVRGGRTSIEMIAGNLKLASKGYLQMYEDITGESFI